MLFINTELIFITADLLLVTAGIKKIPTLGLKDSHPGTKRVPRRDSIWDKVWTVEGGIDTNIFIAHFLCNQIYFVLLQNMKKIN